MSNSPSVPRTQELLDGYRSGDRGAERQLFEEHRKQLLEHVDSVSWMRGLAKYATPDDLVGEVFLRVLSSGLLGQFEARASGDLRRVLFKKLDEVAVDMYRRHGALKRGGGRQPRSYDSCDEEAKTGAGGLALPSLDSTPTSKLRAGELLERCRDVLEEREWEIWHLVEVEGLDCVEIARRLDSSDATVRGVLRRARNQLLIRLAEVVREDSKA